MTTDPAQAYEAWSQTQDPADLDAVIESLSPRINYHLGRLGLADDQMARSKARIYTARAIKTYNPEAGAGLPTWVDRNLVQLQRFNRERSTPVRIPERIQIDHFNIRKAELDFEDLHQREPDLEELADAAGMPVSRIEKVRKTFRKMPSEAAFDAGDAGLPGETEPDLQSEALETLWEDCDKIDRKILELTTGFGREEKSVLSPAEISSKLQLHPSALSRRKARLAARLDEILEMLTTQTQ